MKHATLEKRMRDLEYFGDTRVLTETWSVVRVDGRSFSRLTEANFEKPFDARFHEAMVAVSRALLQELSGIYAYTESDEISVLLPREWRMFGGRVEKIVSVASGLASSVFTHHGGVPAHFDARVWLGPTDTSVVDYFRWRQGDALRCSLNGWCYWTLRKAGQTKREATAALEGRSFEDKRTLLAEHGVTLADLPGWQRQGVGIYEETYKKTGFNPRLQREVWVVRRRLRVEPELPLGEEYARFLRRLLAGKVQS
ncbi:MAG TPA: tRNA 5'-guanylyltransferase [Planctomycetes bacterium]|nr:tRNA 5'-guanylyltransferase [Planctomycetota bacterium]